VKRFSEDALIRLRKLSQNPKPYYERQKPERLRPYGKKSAISVISSLLKRASTTANLADMKQTKKPTL